MDARVHALIAKHDITAALLRFVRGIDRLDKDLVLSAFHADGVANFGAFSAKATDFPEWAFKQLRTHELTSHRISNISIDLHGERANVETYLDALHLYEDVEETVYARYLDLFECRDGDWLISNRLVVIDYSTRVPRNAPYSEAHRYVRPARDKSDPVYTHRWTHQA